VNNVPFDETMKNFFGNLRAVVRNTHASVAIVGASIIAEYLRAALLSRMRPLSKTVEARLFEGYGPLSSFSSRIDIAFALDVVSHQIRDDMNTIKKIRNTFAHSEKILHFTEPEIADLCKKLRTWDVQKTNFQGVTSRAFGRLAATSGTSLNRGSQATARSDSSSR
jgi:DNA-binding MltR family transcriptional regulator